MAVFLTREVDEGESKSYLLFGAYLQALGTQNNFQNIP